MKSAPALASVVYVSWHDTNVLVRSLRQLAAVADADDALEVIVAVNEAGPEVLAAIEAAWPGARVIANPENLGFGPACNQAAAVAAGEILLFLNPDTLARPGAIEEVRRAFDARPDAVAVAPRLVDVGPMCGEDQEHFQLRRLPTLRADLRELLLIDRLAPHNRWHRHHRYLDEDRERPIEVGQAAAAALAVRREAFEAIGGFDERFWPAYWEDVDLCARLLQRGTIVYWPSARVAHVGGGATAVLGGRRFRVMYYRNALRYRQKHYSRTARLAYRALLAVGMTMRAAITLSTSRQAPETSQTLRGFLDVAAMALRGLGRDGPA
jgi:N-acetylglucosaminyl-diphospho-decaprenol L-rhamnosyltransferase